MTGYLYILLALAIGAFAYGLWRKRRDAQEEADRQALAKLQELTVENLEHTIRRHEAQDALDWSEHYYSPLPKGLATLEEELRLTPEG